MQTITRKSNGQEYQTTRHYTRTDMKYAGIIEAHWELSKGWERMAVSEPQFEKMVAEGMLIITHEPENTMVSEPCNWRNDPATEKQLAYIIQLGGLCKPGMTKGEASQYIENLKDTNRGSGSQYLGYGEEYGDRESMRARYE